MGDWAPDKTDTFKDADGTHAHGLLVPGRRQGASVTRLRESSDCSTSAASSIPISNRNQRVSDSSPSLRLVRPRHACRDRRHDRQRQDRPGHRPDRRGGDRRHAGDRDRSEGRPRQPAADLSRARAGGFRAVGRSQTKRAGPAQTAGGVCRRRSGDDGRRAWPSGARTARASSGCATRPNSRSTRRAARGPAAVDREVVRGARPGDRQRCRAAAGSRRRRRPPAC